MKGRNKRGRQQLFEGKRDGERLTAKENEQKRESMSSDAIILELLQLNSLIYMIQIFLSNGSSIFWA